MNATLRIAIVRTGGWARQNARIFSRRLDTELVAIVWRDSALTEARAAEFGTRASTDIDGMLSAEYPVLVSVCLPNEEHFGPTLALAQTGIALLVEKPVVFELDQADRLVDEADQRDTFLAINFNQRFAEPVVRAKAALDSGELSDIGFATWSYVANVGHSPHANLIGRESCADQRDRSPSRRPSVLSAPSTVPHARLPIDEGS